MAATANPSANTTASISNANGIATANNNIYNGGYAAVDPSERALKEPKPIWTRAEHSLMQELFAKYATGCRLVRYTKIALHLQNKRIKDVAVCKWITENGKQRKDKNISSKKQKDKRVKVANQQSSHATNHDNGLPYAQSSTSVDNDNGISCKAIGGGMVGQLLEQNAQALDQISANLSALKLHENIGLFCQMRNNIATLLNDLNGNMPKIMKRMPPLSEKINEELANSILPQSSVQMQVCNFESFHRRL